MRTTSFGTRRLTALALAFAFVVPVAAQQTLDRSKIPPPGKTPALHVPVWTRATLANGAELVVSEKHDLPLVSFSLALLGGANQYEAVTKRGLASLVATMMSEGTKTRDGEALSSAMQLLGTTIGIGVGGETGSVNFQSTSAKFAPALDLLSDILLNPTFPADALERQRAQRLQALAQSKAQTSGLAARAFPRLLYGSSHPYGQYVTEDSYKGITRDDLVQFHRAYFQPGRAVVVVTGDITLSAAKAAVDKALSGWTKAGDKPAFTYPAVPDRRPATIYLVDKPGAAQSTFAIGNPGPPRSTSDYYALQVMNTILGGMFQSRLNANIREDKGYSYGVSSGFAYGKGPGAFRTGGEIVSAKSDAALVEFMKELRGIVGGKPVTDDELATAKDSLIQRLPGQFAAIGSITNAIVSLWTLGLPDTYYQDYTTKIGAITKQDVMRVAKQYIDLDHLAIVIVGDRASIEGPLKATGIAPVVTVDSDGLPVK
jgi:zinc protease